MEILVFKTNLSSLKSVNKIKIPLNETKGIIQWNVDLADRDKILRIKAESISSSHIVNLICTSGFECEELV